MQEKSLRIKMTYVFCFGLATFLSLFQRVYAAGINCQGETMGFIRKIFGYVKIIVPILLIVMGSIDFLKGIIASDDAKIKQAQKDFVTRLIIGVVIFFIPSILDLLLSLIGLGDSCAVE